MWMALLPAFALIYVVGISHAAEHCPPAVQQARKILREEERLIPHASRPLAGASATPDLVKAAQLVEAAERACRAGDMEGANAKANAAISELERRP